MATLPFSGGRPSTFAEKMKVDPQIIGIIYQAIGAGEFHQAISLIRKHNYLDGRTPFGSWLHVSVALGKIDFIDLLLEDGIDINSQGESIIQGNAINSASLRGRLDFVQRLHQNGAKIQTSTSDVNPLLSAIQGNHTHVGKYLIDSGIDISIVYTDSEGGDFDAYQEAKRWGSSGIAELISNNLDRL